MSPLVLVLFAGGLIAASGLVAFVLARAPRLAAFIAVVGAVSGSAVGLWAAWAILRHGVIAEVSAPWVVPGGGLVVGVDPLSAFFLVPLFGVGGMCAIYGRSYLGPLPAQGAMLNLLLSAMTLVLVARHAMLFLVAWEAMTLLAYLLLTLNHGEAEVRRAGWAYLIASHVGVMALIALVLALGVRAGGALDFVSIAQAWRTARPLGVAGILALSLAGFGIKAGIAGLHVWLPEAHAAAPSHVSALMSAVLIKLGIYGLLRTALFVSPGAGFGAALVILGALGALLGIALALTQRDLKRILAYSSVENVGIILLGLGLGFFARARGDGRLAALAFGGGLLHLWNHAAMKGLMFLGAGSVLHGTGTKDVERLGGLLGRMRWTGRAMILGSVAISGLPPLNGLTGEWLLYRALTQLGLTGASPSNLAAMASAATLALVGGLAALCFVRLVGIVLLGAPRSDAAAHAHEAPAAMLVPMAILAGACIAFALAAPLLVSAQATVLVQLGLTSTLGAAASEALAPLGVVNAVLLVAIAAAVMLVARRIGRPELTETWGCGYAGGVPRAQYSARGFAELLTTRALPSWLGPRPRARPPEGAFPVASSFATDIADPATRGIYEPLLIRMGDRFVRLRFLQQGNLHIYLLYVLAAVIAGLTWVAVRGGGWTW